jgi:hypothetical protein
MNDASRILTYLNEPENLGELLRLGDGGADAGEVEGCSVESDWPGKRSGRHKRVYRVRVHTRRGAFYLIAKLGGFERGELGLARRLGPGCAVPRGRVVALDGAPALIEEFVDGVALSERERVPERAVYHLAREVLKIARRLTGAGTGDGLLVTLADLKRDNVIIRAGDARRPVIVDIGRTVRVSRAGIVMGLLRHYRPHAAALLEGIEDEAGAAFLEHAYACLRPGPVRRVARAGGRLVFVARLLGRWAAGRHEPGDVARRLRWRLGDARALERLCLTELDRHRVARRTR